MLKKFSQTMLYLPHFLSWVIIGGMVLQIFAPTSGVINSTLLRWGWISENIPFLTDGPTWTFTYVLVGVWQSMGWGTILYLAAITGLDMNLFEAARIDGANKLQQIWHVTLPGIRSTIVVLLIILIAIFADFLMQGLLRRHFHLRLPRRHYQQPVRPRNRHWSVPVHRGPGADYGRKHRFPPVRRTEYLVRGEDLS